jgi:hypothetical protein
MILAIQKDGMMKRADARRVSLSAPLSSSQPHDGCDEVAEIESRATLRSAYDQINCAARARAVEEGEELRLLYASCKGPRREYVRQPKPLHRPSGTHNLASPASSS